MKKSATARAHPNIAFIKYWGNTNDALRLPANASLSMNLAGIYTETTVQWDDALMEDELILNSEAAEPAARQRVSRHLDAIRQRLRLQGCARVTSANNFPMGAGIASSASAFAALTLAAVHAAGAALSERELSTLARLGSGSAARSVPGGFVTWCMGEQHKDSYAESIAPADHWDLVDVIAVVSQSHKTTGSYHGHHLALTSDLQTARVAGAAARLEKCRRAIMERDFAALAEVVELDSNLMHAVMMTSRPALFYWQPATLAVIHAVQGWRMDGLDLCYTLDAGPNVHCISTQAQAPQVTEKLRKIPGVLDVITAPPGGPARILA